MSKILLDIHTHTIASGHATHATLTDMVKKAKEIGLEILGISDHGPATLGGARTSYFRSLSSSVRSRLGIKMLYGAEVDILDDKGTLDLDNEILSGLDFVIASLHRQVTKPGDKEENTARYIQAMSNPYVKIIGHPDDDHYPVDYKALVEAAIENSVVLEINDGSLRPDGYRGNTKFNDLMILNLCKHYNYPVLLSSDSHGTTHLGDVSYALELAKASQFPEELILNYNTGELMKLLA